MLPSSAAFGGRKLLTFSKAMEEGLQFTQDPVAVRALTNAISSCSYMYVLQAIREAFASLSHLFLFYHE